ncbi:MAG: hypothetical protein KF829_03520 [Ferruginibacter sp.]|nr:hypothetical protein [Ferruginibacter sp.]
MASIILISTFIWIGFISAISFMESWLKFKAPGVTLPLGLGIGKIVFKALNRVESFLAIIILAGLLYSKHPAGIMVKFWFITAIVVLAIQTIWMLPALEKRAQLLIEGKRPSSSKLHMWFVVMETTKVICLFSFGFSFLQF